MSPRRAELAVDLATGLIVISVAVALAGLTWRLAAGPGQGPRGASVRVATPPVDLSPILALAPFGRPAPTGEAVAPGLELRGVLLAQPRSASTVLIAPSGGPPQTYAIGQAVPGGAVIDSIGIDHVVLRVGAQTQLLAFPRPAGAAGVDPLAPPVPSVSGVYVPPPPSSPITSPAEAANNRAFLDTMGATVTDGGYRIGPNPAAAARMAGLLPGDVIQKVNGNAVGDIDRDSRLLDEAFRSGGARVEVLRGGRQFTLSFPVR